MKRYGNAKTELELTAKAAAAYAEADPLEILERETPDGLRYDLRGIEDRDGMTAAELIQWLEDLADETPTF